jgi:hypothetical protein
MKFSLSLIGLSQADFVANLSVNENSLPKLARGTRQAEAKRYDQLKGMIDALIPNWDERQLWDYGCHCLMTTDRPMTDMGYGQPKDKIDRLCKKYKQCLNCVKDDFYGESCINEFVEYGYENEVCVEGGGTCGRGLCECDTKFAEEYAEIYHTHDDQYHGFFGDFRKEESCVRIPGPGGNEPECCRNEEGTSAYQIFNSATMACCKDGSIGAIGTCDSTTPTPPTPPLPPSVYGKK